MSKKHVFVLVAGETGEDGAIIGIFTTITKARDYFKKYSKSGMFARLSEPEVGVPDSWVWDGKFWQIESWPLNPKL